MGGGYYDRDMDEGSSSSYSYSSPEPLEEVVWQPSDKIHPSVNPTRYAEETLRSDAKNPIVFALDVTGSMGAWAKIIYDKMPMFYGQIMLQKYLDEPSLSFAGIGDCKCDDIPLQCSEFGQAKEIDQLISKINLQRSGGGNEHESYELAVYFYANHVETPNTELPFFFVTGDEGFWDTIEPSVIQKTFALETVPSGIVRTRDEWNKLMEKYNVFHIHKPYMSANYEAKIHKQWCEAIGKERVLDIVTPKACIDVILGAIAITNGRSLDQYIVDMRTRGQDDKRIEEVTKALLPYYEMVESGNATIIRSPKNVTITTGTVVGSSSTEEVKAEIDPNDLQQITNQLEELILQSTDETGQVYWEHLKLAQAKNPSAVPKEFICPITGNLIYEPAMTSDGHTFEKKAIELWLTNHDYSPLTGLKLEMKTTIPNYTLKQLIKNYVNANQ